MGDTWKLIGGLVPIIPTESSSKDNLFPCSSISLEGFDELFQSFDELFHAFSSIFLEGFDELVCVLDELLYAILLLLL